MDVRSLALFRICAAVLVVVDLSVRASNIWAFHSYWAAWSIADALAWNEYFISFHFINTSLFFQWLVFLVNYASALCLLVGYKTSLQSFWCWFMMTSYHNRCHLLNNGGDELFRLLLFIGIFLPLGACYSIDSALEHARSSTAANQSRIHYRRGGNTSASLAHQHEYHYFSVWTVAYIVQFSLMYVVSAYLKKGAGWWNGQAVYLALSLDMFVTPTGSYYSFLLVTHLLPCGVLTGLLVVYRQATLSVSHRDVGAYLVHNHLRVGGASALYKSPVLSRAKVPRRYQLLHAPYRLWHVLDSRSVYVDTTSSSPRYNAF